MPALIRNLISARVVLSVASLTLSLTTFAQAPEDARRILRELDVAIDGARGRAVQQLNFVRQAEVRRGNTRGAEEVQRILEALSARSELAATLTASAPEPGRYTVSARSDEGAGIGAGRKGQKVRIQYVEGLWVSSGGLKVSPDRPPHGYAQAALVGSIGGERELIAVVPGGTRAAPFVEKLARDYEALWIVINDTVKGDNAGEVIYRAEIR